MAIDAQIQSVFLQILTEELVPAMGCTEPIAIAFAAAKAREILGVTPERGVAECSSNMIKNVRSVTIPGTLGQVGIAAAVWAGVVAGHPERELEILSGMTSDDAVRVKALVAQCPLQVKLMTTETPLHFRIYLYAADQSAMVEIKHSHTNIVRIERNREVLFEKADLEGHYLGTMTDRSSLSVDDICDFADEVDLALVRDMLERQIDCNMAIAREGLSGTYGVGIGPMMLELDPGESMATAMKAHAAAASEARMSGCTMPVVTNSGSGNQGIASSVPVIVYALKNRVDEGRLLRALVLSNLLTIQQKSLIGRLSAFCSMVCSAAASGAALTYLEGGTRDQIKMAITNTLANTTGVICDGAKPACGAKIAASLDAAFIGHKLAMSNRGYSPGDGILQPNVDQTIEAVGIVAHQGMRETEGHILSVMLKC